MYKVNGKLEVICGPMFSGKSEELIRRIRRAVFGKKLIQVFKHSLDDRYSSISICSHNGSKINATPVCTSDIFLDLVAKETDVVGIDEIQFFDKDIILAVEFLMRQGKHVIVSGLDLDFRGIPFGPIPYLLALADEVTKLKAVCVKSGLEANFTQRIINGKPACAADPIVLIGENNFYEARCRAEFEIDYVPIKEYIEQREI